MNEVVRDMVAQLDQRIMALHVLDVRIIVSDRYEVRVILPEL